MKITGWLKKHHEISSWVQAVGVVGALVFGVIQLKLAREALEFSVKTNEIALRNSASDLLVGINNAALGNIDAAGEFSGHKRLHLMRLHYFYRTYELRKEGLLDDDSFAAEENYLKFSGELPDFKEVWGVFRVTYNSDFRNWIDKTLQFFPEEPVVNNQP